VTLDEFLSFALNFLQIWGRLRFVVLENQKIFLAVKVRINVVISSVSAFYFIFLAAKVSFQFCRDDRFFFPDNWGRPDDLSFAASFPLVSVLGIIDTQALFFISSFTTSSHDFFQPTFLYMSWNSSSLTLLTKFISSIYSRFFKFVSAISVWSLPDDSLYLLRLFYLSASHS